MATATNDELLRGYLEATRIVDTSFEASQDVRAAYDATFSFCVRYFQLAAETPSLCVTYTAQAISETVRLASGSPVVIYDHNQGVTNLTMNQLVHEDRGSSRVARLLLRIARAALLSEGAAAEAHRITQVLTMGSADEDARLASVARRPADDAARSAYQVSFIVAHELAHLALERGTLPDEWARSVNDAFDAVAANGLELWPDPVVDDVEADRFAGYEALLGRSRAQELLASIGRPELGDESIRAVHAGLPERLALHPQLREEAICDFAASVAVMTAFNPPPTLALPDLLLALANHSTLAMMRERLARRDVARAASNAQWSAQPALPIAMRGWILFRMWQDLIRRNESDDTVRTFGGYVVTLRERHDRLVRSVADALSVWIETIRRESDPDERCATVSMAAERREVVSDMRSSRG